MLSEAEKQSLEKRDNKFVDRAWFQMFIACVILANIVEIGIETDYRCDSCLGEPSDRIWVALDSTFAAVYIIEMICRVWCYNWRHFKDLWNLFDLGLVVLVILDAWILQSTGGTSGTKAVSILRIVRLVRILRALRLVHINHELFIIAHGLLEMGKLMIPLFLTLLIFIYIFACYTRLFYSSDNLPYTFTPWNADDYWGTVPKAMLTYFQIFTGDRWSEDVSRPLIFNQPLSVLLFVPFMLICFIALRARLIGHFCEHVSHSAKSVDRRAMQDSSKSMKDAISFIAQEHIKFQNSAIMKFRMQGTMMSDATNPNGTFSTLNAMASPPVVGRLSFVEFTRLMRKTTIRKVLASIDVPVADLEDLFRTLDADCIMSVNADSFFNHCLYLRGEAPGRRVTTMQIAAAKLVGRLSALSERVETLDATIDTISDRGRRLGIFYGIRKEAESIIEPTEEEEETLMEQAMGGKKSIEEMRKIKLKQLKTREIQRLKSMRTTGAGFRNGSNNHRASISSSDGLNEAALRTLLATSSQKGTITTAAAAAVAAGFAVGQQQVSVGGSVGGSPRQNNPEHIASFSTWKTFGEEEEKIIE